LGFACVIGNAPAIFVLSSTRRKGLANKLIDNIEYDKYDEQLIGHYKVQTIQPVRARYVAVLTPAEVRWSARVLHVDPK
jgi:hypothetical protein